MKTVDVALVAPKHRDSPLGSHVVDVDTLVGGSTRYELNHAIVATTSFNEALLLFFIVVVAQADNAPNGTVDTTVGVWQLRHLSR